jgi:hypothetical protein
MGEQKRKRGITWMPLLLEHPRRRAIRQSDRNGERDALEVTGRAGDARTISSSRLSSSRLSSQASSQPSSQLS